MVFLSYVWAKFSIFSQLPLTATAVRDRGSYVREAFVAMMESSSFGALLSAAVTWANVIFSPFFLIKIAARSQKKYLQFSES